MEWVTSLKQKIKNKSIIVGVVGLGYVGLPLAVAFSKKFKVIGYDMNSKNIEFLNQGKSYIGDVDNKKINMENFYPTSDYKELKKSDFIIITVPTPLKEDKTPDLSYVRDAAKTVGELLKKGQFVILESTSYPGTTEEILIPILEEKSGLKVIKDFGVGYSPERVDPGNKKYKIENTPKVVGSLTPEFTEVIKMLYRSIIDEVITVKDCKTAEAVKMVENVFRNVNIALANELALIFERMEINIWEAIDAAKTKPYGFMPFYPGPGVGGHCIPLDPYYMSYRAKQFGLIPRFIETAGEINDFMPIHIVNLAEKGLKKINKQIRNSKTAILGLAYKLDINDTRESPAIRIIEELIERNAEIKVYDPHVKYIKTNSGDFYSEENIEEILKWAECIIFVTAHKLFRENIEKYLEIVDNKCEETVIIDGVNISNNINVDNLGERYYRL
jgi:UDP-N-acetyl-D-glucosamine dehydrogenase